MALKFNFIIGLFNSIWSALIALAVVPFYLKYLGIESYGLIGFFVTFQALMSCLDMGMASTINREVARHSLSGDIQNVRRLLHSLSIIYWVIALIIVLLVFVLSPWIANTWLKSKQLSSQTILNAIVLIGLVMACRWPIGLYQGALIGAQRLAISSIINIIMVTIGSLGAITVIVFISPTIEAFFIWQAFIGLIYALIMHMVAWRVIGKSRHIRFDINAIRSVWRFSTGIGAVTLTSLVFTQLDKVILSKVLGLENFAHYMLATAIVSGLYLLVSPLFNVIYPRFSGLVEIEDTKKIIKLYRQGTHILAAFIFPMAMVVAIFAKDFVLLWTGDSIIATNTYPVIFFLVIGSALNSVMYFPFALQLAYGKTWIPLTINIILICFMTPLFIYLAQSYGVVGGALAWALSEVGYFIFGSWLTHRYILKGLALKWVFYDVGIPMLISVVMGLIGYYTIQMGEYSMIEKLAFAIVFLIAPIIIIFSMAPDLRDLLSRFIGWKKILALKDRKY